MAESLLPGAPADWPWTSLGDISRILAGPSGAVLGSEAYVESADGVPVIMPKDIGENVLIRTDLARVAPDTAAGLARFSLAGGDIVCSRRGTLGRRALIRDENAGWLIGTGCLRVRVGASADPGYVSYYLGHPGVRDWLVRNAVASTIPNINTKILDALPIALPPLQTQRAIGEVLGALDERILANQRVNDAVADLRDGLLSRLLSGDQRLS